MTEIEIVNDFIRMVNNDHLDRIIISRDYACVLRNEILRLRVAQLEIVNGPEQEKQERRLQDGKRTRL